MRLRYLFALLAVCLFSPALSAQNGVDEDSFTGGMGESGDESDGENKEKKEEKFYASRFYVWNLDSYLGKRTPTFVDTIPLNFQNMTMGERQTTVSGEYLANLGSPFQSRVYMDRTQKTLFLPGRAYEHWMTGVEEQRFYNTTTPYTNLRYLTTFGNVVSQEEDFKVLFTVNLNKNLNIGADYEILYSRGFYEHNPNRNKLGNIFGNYISPRYEAFWTFSNSYHESQENGGITDDRYITEPLKMSGGLSQYESTNIPVKYTNATSQVKDMHFLFHHKYHIGFERIDTVPADTAANPNPRPAGAPVPGDTIRTFVPVTSLVHTLYFDRGQRSFRSTTANLSQFNQVALFSDDYTADTASMMQLRNTFGLSLVEGFHSWAKFGLTAFLEHDFRHYQTLSPAAALKDSANPFSRYETDNMNLIWAGGELSKQKGQVLTYSAKFKLCVLGPYIGDFEATGNLKTTLKFWNRPVSLAADGSITNQHPDFFTERYYSNHFGWENNFLNEYRTRARGILDIPALGFKAIAGVENVTNLIYFGTDGKPAQFNGNIQVLSFNWKQHLRAGILNWDNDIVYQLSSNPAALPLPDLALYSDLYLKFTLSKVLLTHVGVDCRYFTSYYAPAYQPATGMFHNQDEIKVGNYPYMNAYANFHLKRMRFFVMYSHVSRMFAKPNYFSAPHYPLNPAILKFGLSWNFYD